MCSYGELNQSFLYVILHLFIVGPPILGRTVHVRFHCIRLYVACCSGGAVIFTSTSY